VNHKLAEGKMFAEHGINKQCNGNDSAPQATA